MSDSQGRKGFWGTTLTRLKSVLAKTKEQVLDDTSEPVGDSTENLNSSAPAPSQPESTSVAPATVSAAPAKVRPEVKVTEDFIESLEERLIKSDLGLPTVEPIIESLRKECRGNNWTSRNVETFLKGQFQALLAHTPPADLKIVEGTVNIFFVVGVNGVGKTTSIGKLASRLKADGKKVLLAAGDTFRAAAESQLEIWADRAGVDIVRLPDGSDPGAVVFSALKKAREEKYDILLIDTAGRLHNKIDLMNELKKVRGVIEKHAGDLPIESLLVLDASTGQNGLQQAKVFAEICGLSGVILTKLDGTAKGGVVFGIAKELKIPVKLIGIGEKIEDLRDFEPELFVEALF